MSSEYKGNRGEFFERLRMSGVGGVDNRDDLKYNNNDSKNITISYKCN